MIERNKTDKSCFSSPLGVRGSEEIYVTDESCFSSTLGAGGQLKRVLISLAILLSVLNANAQKVNVAAAANLKYVLEELKIVYLKQNPRAKVNLTFGASGMLVQQITNGALFDFFMAADNDFPLKLKDKGLTIGPINTYAYGKLVIYSTTLEVDKLGLDALKNPAIKKIAIANPETATYGTRSVELLKSLKLYDQLKSKLVIGENIAQTAQFAFTGNAEIGFIALSLAIAPDMAGSGNYYIISPKLYSPIDQACVLIKTPVLNTEAVKFKKFVLSPANKAIWEKYGYTTPKS